MMAGIDRSEEDDNGSRSPERSRWSLSQRAKGIPTGKGRRIRIRTAITLPFAIRGIWRFSEDIHGTISRTPQGWGLVPVASTLTLVAWRFARDTPQEVCDPLSDQRSECQDGNQKV